MSSNCAQFVCSRYTHGKYRDDWELEELNLSSTTPLISLTTDLQSAVRNSSRRLRGIMKLNAANGAALSRVAHKKTSNTTGRRGFAGKDR